MSAARHLVAVVMGSDSDLPTMQPAIDTLGEFGIDVEVRILSAHRTPDEMIAWARAAADRGVGVVIAGAGGAAHLPGMIASVTERPVVGVPVIATALAGIDALLSIVQMPAGVPVATIGIGNARNAALLAVRMLAIADPALAGEMRAFQQRLHASVRAKDDAISADRPPT